MGIAQIITLVFILLLLISTTVFGIVVGKYHIKQDQDISWKQLFKILLNIDN